MFLLRWSWTATFDVARRAPSAHFRFQPWLWWQPRVPRPGSAHLSVVCIVPPSASGPSPMPQEPVGPHSPGDPGVNSSGDNLQQPVGDRTQWKRPQQPIVHLDCPRRHSIGLSEELCPIVHLGNLNNPHLYHLFVPSLTPPTPWLLFPTTIPLLKSFAWVLLGWGTQIKTDDLLVFKN